MKITVELTETAAEALERITQRLHSDDAGEAVSAALVIYDMHQAAMGRQLERLESSGEGRRMTKNE